MRDLDQIVKLWLFLRMMMEVRIVFSQGKIGTEMTMEQLKKMK